MPPPVSVGAFHVTDAFKRLAVARTAVGAPGTRPGVTVAGLEAADVPASVVAVTVTEYAVPFVSSEIVQASSPVVHVQDLPPVEAVAVERVIAAPPSSAGAVHVTRAEPSPAEAATPVGAPGVAAVARTARRPEVSPLVT